MENPPRQRMAPPRGRCGRGGTNIFPSQLRSPVADDQFRWLGFVEASSGVGTRKLLWTARSHQEGP
jgi:hypothetical protein